jgi:hypothetical protein
MTTLPQQTLDAISTPAQVNTPLGTLQFPLGVPTDETQRLAYDHLDHVHAVNAFLNAFRGVSLWAMRKGFLEAGIQDNDVLLFSELMDAKSLFLTANADTVYGLSFLGLTQGPLVVEAPPMTLDLADDLWFRWITDLSLPGPDCGLGGRYLFVRPGYPACPICRVDCGSVNRQSRADLFQASPAVYRLRRIHRFLQNWLLNGLLPE